MVQPSDPIKTEEAIIQSFLAPLAAGFPGAYGLKDDCAVAAPAVGHEFVFKTDAIAAGVHFLPDDAPADIGWKALAVNVSDLAAKGARPIAYLMSLAFPAAPERDWMAEFARGLGEAQAAFAMHLIGGDTDRRPGPLTITPMVFGEVAVGRMVRRATAEAGDIVFVSGTLGDAALGLGLRRDHAAATDWGLSPAQTVQLIGRYLRPQPRLALAPVVLQYARASMDISDGLMKDLARMCAASGVGATVSYDRLPISEGMRAVRTSDAAAAATALLAGDDYEILAAIAEHNADAFAADAKAAGVSVTAIGRFTANAIANTARGASSATLADGAGRPIDIGATGWDHF